MTNATATHCPTCAAPIREESSKFCAFCGTKLPEAPRVVIEAWAPNSAKRFEAARQHPSTSRLTSLVPSTVSEMTSRWFIACACGALALFGAFVTITGLGARGSTALPVGFGVALLLVGGALTWGAIQHARRFASAPVTRAIAVVADERVSVSGGKHASTTYYATFEFEDGARVEVEVGEELASGLAIHDIGMVYVKRGVLLGFSRIRV